MSTQRTHKLFPLKLHVGGAEFGPVLNVYSHFSIEEQVNIICKGAYFELYFICLIHIFIFERRIFLSILSLYPLLTIATLYPSC